MKNKIKNIILFLIILSLIFPLKESRAFAPWEWIKGKVKAVGDFLKGVVDCAKDFVFCALSYFTYAVTQVVHWVLAWFNNQILAPLVGSVATLNPFYKEDPKSPVVVIWNILKSFAYIILVFSALAAAYEWLFGNDASAKRLIFNIIVVALIISFTYVLVRETFFVVRSLEEGITNNQLDKLGTLIAASLWQKDPFETIDNITNQIETKAGSRYLIQAVFYIFIIVFDMIIFVILFMTLVLLIVRYIMIIFLAGTSSIAAASLTFPEFKGIPALGEMMSQFRFATTWLEYFVKWLLVVPIFVILVILGNILKENTLAQIKAESFVEFIVLLFMLGSWYIISIRIAVKLSGAVGAFAKRLAIAALLTVGGIAAGGLMAAARGTVGGILYKVGGGLQNKVGVGGMFGWRSRIFHMTESMKGIGGKMLEDQAKRLEKELEYLSWQLAQAAQTGNQQQIQKTSNQFADFIRRHQNLFAKDISKGIDEKLSIKTIQRIMETDPQSLQTIVSQIQDQKIKNSFIDKLEKAADKGTLRKMAQQYADLFLDANFRQFDPDIQKVFTKSIKNNFTEEDVLKILKDQKISGQIDKLHTNVIQSFGRAAQDFVNGIINQNVNTLANAISRFRGEFWNDPSAKRDLIDILKNQTPPISANIDDILFNAVDLSSNRQAILRSALSEIDPADQTIRPFLQNQKQKLMNIAANRNELQLISKL
jgi:hypothetical protein